MLNLWYNGIMKKAFTTIEILATVAFLCVAFVLFINQQNQVNQRLRDQERKASINSLYFNLKDVYFKKNGYYPEFIKPDMLDGIDPAIFSDPKKILLGDPGSDYEYKASGCTNNRCQSFTLSAKLETEATYSKSVK